MPYNIIQPCPPRRLDLVVPMRTTAAQATRHRTFTNPAARMRRTRTIRRNKKTRTSRKRNSKRKTRKKRRMRRKNGDEENAFFCSEFCVLGASSSVLRTRSCETPMDVGGLRDDGSVMHTTIVLCSTVIGRGLFLEFVIQAFRVNHADLGCDVRVFCFHT